MYRVFWRRIPIEWIVHIDFCAKTKWAAQHKKPSERWNVNKGQSSHLNIAQRLEKQTRKYRVPVIVSDKTAAALPDMLFRELDTVVVKGRRQPVSMLQPLGSKENASAETRKHLDLHRLAMEASRAGDWQRATDLFSRLRDEWGPADMYELYLTGIKRASS